MTYDELLDIIKSRSEEYGDCWEWQGSKDTSGKPVMRLPGSRKLLPVRRVILEANGKPLRDGHVASTKCNNPQCVNPEHAIGMTQVQLITRAAQTTGYARLPTRNAKISAGKRKRSPFTPEMIDEIRNSPESGRAIARRLGRSQSTIQAIRAYEVWKEYTNNPFFGLAA